VNYCKFLSIKNHIKLDIAPLNCYTVNRKEILFGMEENSTCNVVDHFKWQDYLVCGLMLLISAAIGIFYAWKRKEATTNEILMGGRKMATFPMAMSLLAR